MTKPALPRPVLTLAPNTKGRDFVVGDIHGIFDVLEQALAAVGFDPARDRLISVGDLIDRGPLSHQALDYLAKPWFYALRGNHEHMFLYCMRDGTLDIETVLKNLENGFDWMLRQTQEHLLALKAAFEKLPLAIQIDSAGGKPQDRIGFVHADVPADMTWPEFVKELESGNRHAAQVAMWSRRRINDRDDSGVDGIARVFFGHTPQVGVQQLGNCFFIDTGGVFRFDTSVAGQLYYLMLAETTAPAALLTAPHLQTAQDYRVVMKPPAPPSPRNGKPAPPRP